jgi:hypothetical protein
MGSEQCSKQEKRSHHSKLPSKIKRKKSDIEKDRRKKVRKENDYKTINNINRQVL